MRSTPEGGGTNAGHDTAWMRRHLRDSIYLWACGEKADDEDEFPKLSDRLIGWLILFVGWRWYCQKRKYFSPYGARQNRRRRRTQCKVVSVRCASLWSITLRYATCSYGHVESRAVRCGPLRFGSDLCDSVRFGSARFGSARGGAVRCNAG